MMGAGSLLELELKAALLLYLVLSVVQTVAVLAHDGIMLYGYVQDLAARATAIGSTSRAVEAWALFGALLQLNLNRVLFATGILRNLFTFFVPLLLPVLAIWVAECNADRFALSELNGGKGVVQALLQRGRAIPWWRWLLFRLTHPPAGLRRWLLEQRADRALTILLLLYPVGSLLGVLPRYGQATALV